MKAWVVATVTLWGAAPVSAGTVRVLAAASLTDAFRDLAAAFQRAHPGDRVELAFAGSQVLAAQIEQGAPADVFASADREHVDALKAEGLLGAYAAFARNRIVLVAPAGDAKIARVTDLARPGTRVVVAGPAVPAGRYTAAALARLEPGLARQVRANVVSEEANVRAVLAKVVLGEADAGFVYATDAASAGDDVRRVAFPEADGVAAEYFLGVLRGAAAPDVARAFVDMVLASEGQDILRRYGFTR
jgi:molybdate transport system substrate-binding protein